MILDSYFRLVKVKNHINWMNQYKPKKSYSVFKLYCIFIYKNLTLATNSNFLIQLSRLHDWKVKGYIPSSCKDKWIKN